MVVQAEGKEKKKKKQAEKSVQEKICPNSSLERKKDTKKCNHRYGKKTRLVI